MFNRHYKQRIFQQKCLSETVQKYLLMIDKKKPRKIRELKLSNEKTTKDQGCKSGILTVIWPAIYNIK